MTPSQLKAKYLTHNPDGHYFQASTMRFFGDTMKNYRVIDRGNVWELARRSPVMHGLKHSCYFSKIDFDSCTELSYFSQKGSI